jgi:hypothetical protein
MADRPTRGPRARATLLLLVVFVLGMVCGAALFHIGQLSMFRARGPGAEISFARDPVARLARHLDFDDAQRASIREILERDRAEVHAILERSRGEIREILTPEQRETFDRMHRPPLPPPAPRGPHPPHGRRSRHPGGGNAPPVPPPPAERP